MKKKILILGHSGFVGSEVSNYFKKKKIQIDCFSSKKIILGNINNKQKKTLKNLVKSNDIIINCVGENFNPKKMNENNYEFVKNLLNLIKKNKSKKYLVHLSSCAVYGKYFHFKDYEINKNTIPKPISKYALTKLKADMIIEKSKIKNLRFTIIRPSQVLGSKMKALGFIHLKKIIQKRLFVFVSTKLAVRNYVLVGDLCEYIYKICKFQDFNNDMYIISRHSNLIDIVKFIEKKLSINRAIHFVMPKFLMITVIYMIKFIFFIKIPVNKENIEGLSTTTRIKSNIPKKYKLKLNNIDLYLINLFK